MGPRCLAGPASVLDRRCLPELPDRGRRARAHRRRLRRGRPRSAGGAEAPLRSGRPVPSHQAARSGSGNLTRDQLARALPALAMALAGPLLIALGCAQLDASPVAVNLVGQAGLVLLAVGTLAIAWREGLGWDALGLRRPDVVTLVGGVALALVYMYVATPVV